MNKPDNRFYLFKLLILLSVPYLALGLSQQGFLAMLPFVRDEFALSRTQVGMYSTCFSFSSALLAIYTGSIVDKLGARKGMLLGIGFMSSVILLYGFAPSYPVLLIFAFLAGLGWSTITPSVNKGLMTATPPDKRAISMGIMQSGVGIGGIAGASLLPIIAEIFGWRLTIQFSAVFALVMWFLVYFMYRDINHYNNTTNLEKDNRIESSFRNNLITVIKNKKLFQVCVLGLIFGISTGAVLSHFAVFLSEDLSLSRTIAGIGLASFQVGGILGRPFWGIISDRYFKSNRSQTLYIIGITVGIVYLFSAFLIQVSPVNMIVVFILAFLIGATAFGWMGVHFVAIAELAGDEYVGIATGLSLLFLRVGVLVAPPIFGFIADLQGNYQLSWFLFGLFVIVASVGYRLVCLHSK